MSVSNTSPSRTERTLLLALGTGAVIWIVICLLHGGHAAVMAFLPDAGALVAFTLPAEDASTTFGTDTTSFAGELVIPGLPLPALVIYLAAVTARAGAGILIGWGVLRLSRRMLAGDVFHSSVANALGFISIGIALGIVSSALHGWVSMLSLELLPADSPLAASADILLRDIALLLMIGTATIAVRIGARLQRDTEGLV
ncbi:hypothetical protein [uncultured Agrococcus sp.]|uniref:hypothetical protein n=1 Tax=uncultured Agrococcus sp. TaxID=382258 RepID=UPI0025E5EEEB|nr:hypothetical protein [uncultured Agrococcus sp.]